MKKSGKKKRLVITIGMMIVNDIGAVQTNKEFRNIEQALQYLRHVGEGLQPAQIKIRK